MSDREEDNTVEEVNTTWLKLHEETKKYYEEAKAYIEKFDLLRRHSGFDYMNNELVYEYIYSLSVCIRYCNDVCCIEELSNICLNSNILSVFERKFLIEQISENYLKIPEKMPDAIDDNLAKAHKRCVSEYEKAFEEKLRFVPREERNHNRVYVLVRQFFGGVHQTTNLTMSLCYYLRKEYGFSILIINTKEYMSPAYTKPFFGRYDTFEIEEFDKVGRLTDNGETFDFYQCRGDMPNLEQLNHVIDAVIGEKPGFIVSIGGYDVTADVCSNLVPVVSYSLHSRVSVSQAAFLPVYNRAYNGRDIEILEVFGRGKENIIEYAVAPFQLKEKEHVYSRNDFNLPDDRFIIAISGTRLNDDMNKEAIDFAQLLIKDGAYIVFIGGFDKYGLCCEEYPAIASNSAYVGYQRDFRAFMEICDLFLNPRREGNGSSALYSMAEGTPVVTLPGNDVAGNAGEDFTVESYDEMRAVVSRYMNDKDFYKAQADKARLVADAHNNSANIRHVVEHIRNSPLF